MIRLLLAAGISLFASLIGTWLLIRWLTRLRIGQPIHEDVPEGHVIKAGTPTMGGLAIVGGAVLGYAASALYEGAFSWTGLACMGAIIGAGAVGFVDDGIKVFNERNAGLSKRAKSLGLLAVALGYVVVMLAKTNVDTRLAFMREDSIGWQLGEIGWGIFAIILISATANAVNLTDGLDGLAAGSASIVFATYTVIGYWIFRYNDFYGIKVGLDLAVLAVCMLAACAGFLWWNAAPARIFMGDTGSLAIGTGLAVLALSTSTHLLLPIIGAVFVMETVSVILQVFSFRVFKRRIFKMAPIHHHFELMGWPETTVIIRMWMMSGIACALGVGLFYRDWVRAFGRG